MPDSTPPHAPQFLLDAVRRIVTPVVRLLLHFGITYPVFAELIKRVYVQVADREFALPEREQTALDEVRPHCERQAQIARPAAG